MRRKSLADMQCSIAQTLEIVGEWWTLMIVRSMFGFKGFHKFEELQAELGIARNILKERLDTLIENGIVEKRQYREHPPRYDYHLTKKGQDLFPVIIGLLEWGDQHAVGPEGPPVILHHTECSRDTTPYLACSCCHQPITAHTVTGRDAPHIVNPGKRFA
jgi:DNA-binding HxlR family transcriptional regulator